MSRIEDIKQLIKKAKESPMEVQVFIDLYLPKFRDIDKLPESVFLKYTRTIAQIKQIRSIKDIELNLIPLLEKYTREILEALPKFRELAAKYEKTIREDLLKFLYQYLFKLVGTYIQFAREQNKITENMINSIKFKLQPFFEEYKILNPEDNFIFDLWKNTFEN